jgi:vacuolar-type H+-ATPase subunit F/Vma7
MDVLNRLLENHGVYTYFFANLKSPKWLKPLKDKGYFDLDKIPNGYELPEQPGTISYPPWMPLFYLKKLIEKNHEKPNREVIAITLEIVDSIIDNHDNIDNINVFPIILDIISNLPVDKIEAKHIEFIRTVLKSSRSNISFVSADIKEKILPALLKGDRKDLVLHLLSIMFDFEFNGRSKPLIDNFWLNESLKAYEKSIVDLCGIESANVALEKIKEIVDLDPQFSVAAIENHEQDSFPDEYNCLLVRFVRDIYESADPQDIEDLIIDLIENEAPILKRLAIHTINHHYEELKNLFWDLKCNPLSIYGLRHEIYTLLKTHVVSFNDKEIQILIGWIENIDIPEGLKDNESEAYFKLIWINAVKESKNKKIQILYKKYIKIYPKKIEHPDFYAWHGPILNIIPTKPKKLCEKSNNEIADFLNSINQENELLPEFSKDGTYGSFGKCAETNPIKFSKDLQPFLKIPRKNQHELLEGLLEALRVDQNFEWEEILKFIINIIDSKSFWNEKYSNFNYRDWIISTIADIIEYKSKNDSIPFKKELLPKISEILIKLANKTDSELYPMEDVVISVLNSPMGKIYHAMINFSLSNEDQWHTFIKPLIEKDLDNPSIELSVVLGQYLPHLFVFDKKWIIQNIDRIFHEKTWPNAFSAYIYRPNPIYEGIYKLLKEKGYYEKAINTDFNNEMISKNLVYQICSAYLFEHEYHNNKNSLICKLIQKQDRTQLSEIVQFFLMQKDGNYEIAKLKIKPIWKVLFKLVSENPDNFKELISNLSNLLVFFDEIDDEVFEWIMLSAKYIKIGSNHRSIVDNLLKCVEKSPEKVSKIFIEILNNGTYPDYKKENIQKIVEILYQKGKKESADKICNMYGKKNIHFLRELYNQYNDFK